MTSLLAILRRGGRDATGSMIRGSCLTKASGRGGGFRPSLPTIRGNASVTLRSGGSVDISASTRVLVRAHVHPEGFARSRRIYRASWRSLTRGGPGHVVCANSTLLSDRSVANAHS